LYYTNNGERKRARNYRPTKGEKMVRYFETKKEAEKEARECMGYKQVAVRVHVLSTGKEVWYLVSDKGTLNESGYFSW
jgi:hypothetical protein